MSIQQTIGNVILFEGTTAILTLQLTDAAGEALPLAQLHAVTLTLYDQSTGEILNDRENANIKNAGGGVIDADGSLELTLADADQAYVGPARTEWHVARIAWSYAGGAKGQKKEISFRVAKLRPVPAVA